MKNFNLFTLFFLLFGAIVAQKDLNFSLLDSKNGDPISGAFFAYDTLQFGVSDNQGGFLLRVQPETLLLSISHLSYQDTSFLVERSMEGKIIIPLQPASIVLPEISVSDQPGRKFRSPVHLLKMTLRAIPENYETNVTYPIGYYQETITHTGCPVSQAEGLFEYRLSPYGEKHNHKQAWKAAWDRRYASYARPFVGGSVRLGFDHAEGTQHYPAINDAYYPIQTRYSQRSYPLDAYSVFTDGPLDMVTLDKVRLGYDFLSTKELKNYKFSLVDSTFMNGVYCYHLSFIPSDETSSSKYHGLNKTSKVATFSGHLYIDIQTLAIVSYEAWNSKLVVRNFASQNTQYAPAESIQIHVNYAINQANKWQLSTVESRVRSITDTSFFAIRSLHLDEGNGLQKSDSKKSWYGFNFTNHLHNLTYRVDTSFWNDFNHSSLAKAARFSFPENCRNGMLLSADFSTRSIRIPNVNPRGDLRYVKTGKQKRSDWGWLESPADSATLAYLRWENDYYAQYFLKHRPVLDAVAAQFSSANQGVSMVERDNNYPDTLLQNGAQGFGFYQINGENDERPIVTFDKPPKGYAITDYGWSQTGNYFHILTENRAYDGLLIIYDLTNEVARLKKVNQCQWQGDTLYALTNNELLRTNAFLHYTNSGGWTKLLEEAATDVEFRMHKLPDGELVVIKESLTTASVIRKRFGMWIADEKIMPALLAGTGPQGTSCEADIANDYIVDCRQIDGHQCIIIAKDARQQLYVRQLPGEEWSEVPLPIATSLVSFTDQIPNAIVVDFEGIDSYGRQAIVDVAKKKLKFLPNPFISIELTGYKDSLVWVEANDGTLVPCQLRWKVDQQDSLKSTLLKVYGAYGNPYFVGHSETDIALMNLGFAVVYVHTRGGGILGPEWYDAGRVERKIVACNDYVAALHFFKNNHPLGVTSLSGYAQSAGGPILGYAVNKYPDLLETAVFDHAFLDVAGIMQRPDLPLTQYEYPEWGDPSKKVIRRLQADYSPFQNIRTQSYPAMYFIAGFHDQSTPYWQIAKFVAALRWTNKSSSNIIFHTNLNGSHPGTPFGPTQQQRYEQIAFLITTVKK